MNHDQQSALSLLKHHPIAVCRLHSSIFISTKLEDLGGFTGPIAEVSCVPMMLSPPGYETKADRSSHSKQYH